MIIIDRILKDRDWGCYILRSNMNKRNMGMSIMYSWDCENILIRRVDSWGTWVAQSVERPTLGGGPGHDFLQLVRLSHASGSVLTAWACLDSLSLPFLPLPHACVCPRSCTHILSQNRWTLKKKKGRFMLQSGRKELCWVRKVPDSRELQMPWV